MTPVATDRIRVSFAADCGQKPSDMADLGLDPGLQASVYVAEIQVWGSETGGSAGEGTVTGLPTNASTVILAGTKDDPVIKMLQDSGKLAIPEEITGADAYEQYNIQVVDNPFDGISQAVVITGSDKRGAIYGLYHISQDLAGVSPWYYWGDVPVIERSSLTFGRNALRQPPERLR